jgi:hypothetical protein
MTTWRGWLLAAWLYLDRASTYNCTEMLLLLLLLLL